MNYYDLCARKIFEKVMEEWDGIYHPSAIFEEAWGYANSVKSVAEKIEAAFYALNNNKRQRYIADKENEKLQQKIALLKKGVANPMWDGYEWIDPRVLDEEIPF